MKIETSPPDSDLKIETSPPDSGLKIEISPPDKSLIDLASKIYDEPQLLKIVRFNGLMDELNAQYPIECLRREGNGYRAAYLGDGCVAVLRFDNYGNKYWAAEIYNTQWLKSDFDGLKKGQLLAEVINFDPDGDYIFLYTGRNDTPRVSSHFTKDGYLISIEYDDSNNIISINEELL